MALTHDVVLVTRADYPALFEAFERISHDCGRQAGHTNYPVPATFAPFLGMWSRQLGAVLEQADRDFEALCIGDETDCARVVAERELDDVHDLLNQFFEGWPDA